MKSLRRQLNRPSIAIGKWVILLGMVYLAVRFVTPAELVGSFAQISLPGLIGFLALTLLSKFLYTWRWQLICTKGLGLSNLSTWFLLRVNLLAEFAGIALPSILGAEAVRFLKLNSRSGMAGRITVAIATDRFIGIVGMGLLVVMLLPQLGMSLGWTLPIAPAGLMSGLALGLVGSGAAAFWLRRRTDQVPLSRPLQQLEFGAGWLMFSIVLTLAGHLILAGSHYFLFREIQPLPLLTVIALVLTSQLARTVPISFLGIGLSEGSMVALASLVGIKSEVILTIVIILLGARYFFALLGLLLELMYDGRSFLTLYGRRQAERDSW